MKRSLVPLLACPVCRADLTLQAREWDGDECMDGDLACSSCDATWAVVRGIPRFAATNMGVDQVATAANFGWQWSHFTQEDERYAAQFLRWIQPVRAEDFMARSCSTPDAARGVTRRSPRGGARIWWSAST